MSRSASIMHWENERLRVGETWFIPWVWTKARSDPDRFIICKSREMVASLGALVAELQPRNIVELGIYDGGSTAFYAEPVSPAKLVAVELDQAPNHALASYIERRGLHDVVKPYYGVDQGDRVTLEAILAENFGDQPLDLVLDDASHRLIETRVSFNVLFPRLRPGGLYVLEDWGWANVDWLRAGTTPAAAETPGLHLPSGSPLTALVYQLVTACASRRDVIRRVAVDSDIVVVERGSAAVDIDSFDIANEYVAQPGQLVVD